MTPIDRYRAAYLAYVRQETPTFYEMSGGDKMRVTVPDTKTTNGLTNFIQKFITYSGGYANRINVAGRMIGKIVKTESGAVFDDRRMIKSSTKKGTADLMCGWQGLLISLEIKNKYTRDRASDSQDKEQNRIQRAGGIYARITCVEDFFIFWDRLIEKYPKQKSIFDTK